MPRGSNAPKQGQQGFQTTPPKPKDPKRRNGKTNATVLKLTPASSTQQNPTQDMSTTYNKFEKYNTLTDTKKSEKRITRKERLEKQVEELFDIKNSLERYSSEYKRSAVKDLMAQQKLTQVLNSLSDDEHLCQYSSSESETLLKKILTEEGATRGNKLLTSFAADNEAIFNYLDNKGYIMSLNEVRDEAERIVLEGTVQEAENYLQNISEKFPAAEKVLKSFKDDYNLNSFNDDYLFDDEKLEEDNGIW